MRFKPVGLSSAAFPYQPALAPDLVPSRRRRRAAFACAIVFMVLACVGLATFAHHVAFSPIDLTITRSVQSVHAAWFELPLRALNVLGFPPLVGIVYGTVILLILSAGRYREAVASSFATLGAAGLNELAKTFVNRPRPLPELVHVAHHVPGSGFPAGHVLNATAFLGFLCYLTCVRLASSWRRTALIALLLAMIVLMGVARIDAGEHWPSDVLGGYFLGALWLAGTIKFYRWKRFPGSMDRGGRHAENERRRT